MYPLKVPRNSGKFRILGGLASAIPLQKSLFRSSPCLRKYLIDYADFQDWKNIFWGRLIQTTFGEHIKLGKSKARLFLFYFNMH